MKANSELEKISMMIITYAGISKSASIQAMDNAEKGLPYKDLLESAEENLNKSHKEHFKAIKIDAEKGVNMNVLFIHAEDQMMNSETLFIIAKRMAGIYEKIK